METIRKIGNTSHRERRRYFLQKKEKEIQRKLRRLDEIHEEFRNRDRYIVGWKLVVALSEEGEKEFGKELGIFITRRLTSIPDIQINGTDRPHPKLIDSIVKKNELTPENVFNSKISEYEMDFLRTRYFTWKGYNWFMNYFKVSSYYHDRYDYKEEKYIKNYRLYHIKRSLSPRYWKFDVDPIYRRPWTPRALDTEWQNLIHELYTERNIYKYSDTSVRYNEKYRWTRATRKREARKEIEDALEY